MTRSVWLHVGALWSLAVAQPLLGLLGASPEFFVAHRAGAADVLTLTLLLVVGLPAALSAGIWATRVLGARAERGALLAVIGALGALLVVQAAIQAGAATWVVAMPVAVAAGIAAAFAYARVTGVRSFCSVLSVAIVVVPAVFLTRPGIRTLVFAPVTGTYVGAAAATSEAARDTPVVLVIFDELPLVSLLDSRFEIDRALYPNFAALADDGIWFRNATTVHDFTPWAVPAILTGRYPRAEAVPTAADHPNSLFTLLSRTHRFDVRETLTSVCPLDLCQPADDMSIVSRLRAIALDLRVVFLRIVLTPDLTQGLPDPTETWAGFGAAETPRAEGASPGDRDDTVDEEAAARAAEERERQRQMGRVATVRQFIADIGADDPQPSLYVLHTLISHHPYNMLPGNHENKTAVNLPGKGERGWSRDQQWAVAQNYQKQLLQTGFVDDLVGQLVARMKDAGLYDRSMIVITSDHGVSYVPGTPQRNLHPLSAAEIMRIPLVIKLPARLGIAGEVRNVNAESVDIVPTIADALDLALPFATDGSSLIDPARPERPTKTMFVGSGSRPRTMPASGPDIEPALRRKLELFGDGPDNPYRVPRLPPYDAFVGRPVSDLQVADGGGPVALMHPWEFDDVDLEAEAVPFDVAGMFGAPRPDTFLAVAVNSSIAAVTRTWNANPRAWLATPPLDVWRSGPNTVEVFVIDEANGQPLFRRTTLGSVRPADLNLMSPEALDWGVLQSNFYPFEEFPDGRTFRWSRGWVELSNLMTHGRPREVDVEIVMIPPGPPTKTLRIEANGCVIFEGDVRNDWRSTLTLDRCEIGQEGLTLRFTTDAPRGEVDGRRLGVAISRVFVR